MGSAKVNTGGRSGRLDYPSVPSSNVRLNGRLAGIRAATFPGKSVARRLPRMRRSRRLLAWLAGTILAGLMLGVLLSAAGCSQPAGVSSGEAAGQTSQQAAQPPAPQKPPFPSGDSLADGSSRAQYGSNASDAANSLEAQSLPAGTLLTVRLTNALAAAAANSSFEAIVADPVMLEGETRIPLGTVVEGRVESVRTSNVRPERGLVQLTLSSVRLAGVDVPIRTASLFGRQTAATGVSSSDVLLEKGRRLTFRFTEPVSIPTQRTRAER
jgi:hypothetical protein